MLALGAAGALMAMVREQDLFFVAGPAVDFLLTSVRLQRSRLALLPAVAAGVFGFAAAFMPQAISYLRLNGHVGPSRLVTRKMSWHAPHALQVLLSPEHGFFIWTPLALIAIVGLVWLAVTKDLPPKAGSHETESDESGDPPIQSLWLPPSGGRFPAGDTTLRVIATPGHAPDHLCFFDEASRDLYCGDLARIGGSVVIPASTGGDLREYLASLQRIRALAPRRLLPGHGPIVEDPIALIDEYLAHRELRDRQILDAVASGARTVEEIVQRVYVGLSPTLKPAASETVRAHLQKLKQDGELA
jgi:glyoxylase-like metal-dependent hydrolase (beta-lactamase superfamily II)